MEASSLQNSLPLKPPVSPLLRCNHGGRDGCSIAPPPDTWCVRLPPRTLSLSTGIEPSESSEGELQSQGTLHGKECYQCRTIGEETTIEFWCHPCWMRCLCHNWTCRRSKCTEGTMRSSLGRPHQRMQTSRLGHCCCHRLDLDWGRNATKYMLVSW